MSFSLSMPSISLFPWSLQEFDIYLAQRTEYVPSFSLLSPILFLSSVLLFFLNHRLLFFFNVNIPFLPPLPKPQRISQIKPYTQQVSLCNASTRMQMRNKMAREGRKGEGGSTRLAPLYAEWLRRSIGSLPLRLRVRWLTRFFKDASSSLSISRPLFS